MFHTSKYVNGCVFHVQINYRSYLEIHEKTPFEDNNHPVQYNHINDGRLNTLNTDSVNSDIDVIQSDSLPQMFSTSNYCILLIHSLPSKYCNFEY